MTKRRKKVTKRTDAHDDEWMTLQQAATALGKHRQTVLGLGATGQLLMDRRAGFTFVTRASVAGYLSRQQAEKQRAQQAA